jgi:hypothetical protein
MEYTSTLYMPSLCAQGRLYLFFYLKWLLHPIKEKVIIWG